MNGGDDAEALVARITARAVAAVLADPDVRELLARAASLPLRAKVRLLR